MYRNIVLTLILLAYVYRLLMIASDPSIADAQAPAIHHRFFMAHGYLRDKSPATDGTLQVWSKTHKVTYQIAITTATVFKFHTAVIPRSQFHYNDYVIVSCTGTAPDHLTAVLVHLEAPRKKKKA
jgi:hypothetical protein